MTEQEICQRLKEAMIIELRLEDVTLEDFEDDMPLFGEEGLALDSLDAVELVVLVEKHFGVAIADAEEAKTIFLSARALAKYIKEQRDAA